MKKVDIDYHFGNEIDSCKVITINDGLADDEVDKLINGVIYEVYKSQLQGAIINLSKLKSIDLFLLEKIMELTKTIKMLGYPVIWTGLSAGIIATILLYQVDISNVITSRTIDEGIYLIVNHRVEVDI